MTPTQNLGAGGTPRAAECVQVVEPNSSEDKPDLKIMQMAPVFDPAHFPILSRHWPSAEARWAA